MKNEKLIDMMEELKYSIENLKTEMKFDLSDCIKSLTWSVQSIEAVIHSLIIKLDELEWTVDE